MTADTFYMQDSRSYVGNDMLFWAHGGRGYTTDVSKAQTYSRDEALLMHSSRPTDIPWLKSYIDQRTRPTVDMQCAKKVEATKEAGIELIALPRHKTEPTNCVGCGRFVSVIDKYSSAGCPSCGADNRP